MKSRTLFLSSIGLLMLFALGRRPLPQVIFEAPQGEVGEPMHALHGIEQLDELSAKNPWAFPLMEPKATIYNEKEGKWILCCDKQPVLADAELFLMGFEQSLYPIQFEGFSKTAGGCRFFLRDVGSRQVWALKLGECVPSHGHTLIDFAEKAQRGGKQLFSGECDPTLVLKDSSGNTQVLTLKSATYTGPIWVIMRDGAADTFELELGGEAALRGGFAWRVIEAEREHGYALLERTDLTTQQMQYIRIECPFESL